jgi:excisionase family DNA binding protein
MADVAVTVRRILTVQEVSKYLHVHPSTVYRLLKRRELPAFRIGGAWRFVASDIDKWANDYRSELTAAQVENPDTKR